MKLKKIASLMLAGVMAVSMLTACDAANNDGDDNQGDDSIVIPVDNSLATAVNKELSAAVKNTLTITADASLTTYGKDSFYNSNPIYQTGLSWKYFSDEATSVKTTVDLIVYDGALTEEGLAHAVATDLKDLIDNDRMPNDGENNKKEYDYDYTANIVSVKIDDMRGDNSHYVVALKVVQTPTEVVNVNV